MDYNKFNRSIYKITIIIFLISFLLMVPVSISASNNEKNVTIETNYQIDEYLRNLVKNDAQDMIIPVIVVLNEQPAHDISIKVKKEYKKEFEKVTGPAEGIYGRIKPLMGSEDELRGKTVSELVAKEQSILTGEEKIVLINVGEELDLKKNEMRRQILSQTVPFVNKSQKPIIEKIKANGGNVKYSSTIYNAIAADIPVSYIEKLSREKGVYRIHHDYVMKANLDVSTQAMGANTWWSSGYTGAAMDAAIVDSGIDGGHPALNVDYAGVFHTTGVGDSYYADNPGSTDDLNGHGTHVAGIVASTDSVYKGTAFGIDKLINAKAGWHASTGAVYMYYSDAMQAVDWSIYGVADGADVISLSYGGGPTNGNSDYDHFYDAVVYYLDIPAVMSAGNDGPGSGTVTNPAGAYNVIGVGNIDDKNSLSRSDDSIDSTSSRGPTSDGRIKPDISAPGTNINSADNYWETTGDFLELTGTSMAAPHITGAILLVMDYKNSNWQPEAIKALLLNTAEDKGISGPDNDYGFGYVDMSHVYVHRDDVFSGSIDDLPEGNVEKFYKGSINSGETATLVWNRHVNYNGPNYPSSYLSLSNLDLFMYNEASNALIDSSVSTKNNAEQVKSNAFYSSVVLKIEPTGTFPSGITLEDYAIATEDGYIQVTPPILNLNVNNPSSINSGTNFVLNATVTNNGGLSANSVDVSVSLPAGFTIVSGANPQTIGTITPAGSNVASWVVKAPGVTESTPYGLGASTISNSYGESYSGSNSNVITVEPPVISILSPLNIIYNTIDINLNVSANETISTWLYSLNYAPNVSFTPNTTIIASEGANNLIVYANDTSGNWSSSMVDFLVNTNTITVDDSGGADYTSIQAAVDNASTGDTILVSSGTYYENVNVNNQLTLKGVGQPVVDASGSGNAITLSADGITLDGFTARNSITGILITSSQNIIVSNIANSNIETGIKLTNSNNNMLNNNVASNNAYGIRLNSGSDGNSIISNTANDNQNGILTILSSYNAINHNTVNSNTGPGIFIWLNSNNSDIIGNLVIANNNGGNSFSGGILIQTSSNNKVENNTIMLDSRSGIGLLTADNNDISKNIIENNVKGIYLDSSSENNIYNNIIKNTNNIVFISTLYHNNWNISKASGINIIGGPYISGNFWDNPSGTGFSQICADVDSDGLCDTSYTLNALNIDYLPLVAPDTKPPIINITSPQTIIYSTANIHLNASANEVISTWFYSLNDAPNVSFIPNNTIVASEGANSLIVYANDTAGNWNSSMVNFSVDSMPPLITIISPENSIYSTTDISLNVSANETISTWLYSLNGAPNVSFIPNSTIVAPEGANNLIVYANDTAGNWNSSVVDFSIDTIAPSIITDLQNITYASTYINWTWVDPSDEDLSKVMVFLDGIFQANVSKGVQYYIASGLIQDTIYEISTKTIDIAGNINSTWVNQTATTAPPRIITVDDSGGADYTSIQAAVDDASVGDIILVKDGTYTENIDLNKRLTLKSENGSENTIVQAANPNDAVFYVTVNNVNITGFNITGATGSFGIQLVFSNNNTLLNNTASNSQIGIRLSSSNNNTLLNNTASTNDYGITLSSSSNNTLLNNTASTNGNGITLSSSSNNTLIGNTASNNTGTYSVGIALSSNNTLLNNTASNNYYGITLISNNTLIGNTASNNYYGIALSPWYSSNNNTFINNSVSNNIAGIMLRPSSNNNTFIGNTVSNNSQYGIWLESSSNNILNNNYFNNIISVYIKYSATFNNWNATQTAGMNIVAGPYIVGNFWANPSETGFSQTCADTNTDGICDSSYTLDFGNVDYLPLAVPPPGYINGTVLNNGTGLPGVVVTIDTGVSTTADGAGFYSLLLEAGTYTLNATSELEYYSNSSVVVNVVSGITVVQDIELVKKPTGTISGNVAKTS